MALVRNLVNRSLVIQGILIAAIVALLASSLFFVMPYNTYSSLSQLPKLGEVAPYTVKSPRDVRFAVGDTDPLKQKRIISVKQGEVLLRAGDKVTGNHIRKFELLKDELADHEINGFRSWFGGVVATFSLLVVVGLFSQGVGGVRKPSAKDFFVVGLSLVGSLIILRGFSLIATALSMSFPVLDEQAVLLAAPLAAGGILLQVTVGTFGVLVFSIVFSCLTPLFFPNYWNFAPILLAGNLVGARTMSHRWRRSTYVVAGLRVACTNALLVGGIILLLPELPEDMHIAWIISALLGGFSSGVLAAGLTPIAELIGGYSTDVKLLELASFDRPLLRELSQEAPGTWNHSLMMSQLSEVAADVIGARALLAKVGAFYHDIGKMKKPSYFIENQSVRENKHDKLPPSMSALIIKAHVKDGIDLAQKHNLPREVIDLIAQHHGTSLIECFYDKAKREAAEGEIVEEAHYRYPGPKPQTKEAGILMLADAVEASARTLQDPTPSRIQGLVQKIINVKFASGQLDESTLTLRDLHQIARSFTRVVSAVYHRRINYHPDVVQGLRLIKNKEGERVAGTNGADSNKGGKSETDGEQSENSASNGETLRRLGLSA